MRITIRTIKHAMLPRTTSCKSEKLLNVGDPVLARDFRPGQTWTAGTVAGRRGSVLYEVQVNGEIMIRHRNQLKHGNVENSTAPSMPWSHRLHHRHFKTAYSGKTSNFWKPTTAINTTTEENPNAAEKTASGPEFKVPRGKRSLKEGGIKEKIRNMCVEDHALRY